MYMCIHDHDYVMDFYFMVMIRSTMGPYGRPMIEVAYGKMIFHSTEAIWEMLAWEEWLGCWHDASPMFDIPGSTSVWVSYMIFSDFHDIKIYIYYKRNTGGF